MGEEALISFKMGEIKSIFQSAKDFATENENRAELQDYLGKTNLEFRSVAYEGVSMALALKDLSHGNLLTQWSDFLNTDGKDHAVQVHAGLGWALAQENMPATPFLDSLSPLMRYRILDGYGYYNGIVKQRQTIKEKRTLDWLLGTSWNVYFQGVGRSIYYLNIGNIQKVKEVIGTFPQSNQADLWRGVGVACAYVGGCSEATLKVIFDHSENYRPQLATGATLVARARKQSLTLTQDIETTCKLWCNRGLDEIIQFSENLIPRVADPKEMYGQWIVSLERGFKVSA